MSEIAKNADVEDNTPFIISYEDADRDPEFVFGRQAALARFEQVSLNWNAHLFAKVCSNHDTDGFGNNAVLDRDCVALVRQARQVMQYLEEHGTSIVPHLLDTDENPGQRLRDLLDQWPEG